MFMRFSFDGKIYEIDKFMLAEARAIQKATGYRLKPFQDAINEGDVECIAAIIWIAQKRDNPALRFDQVDGDLETFEPLANDEIAELPEESGAEGKDAPPDPVPSPTAGTSSAAE